MRVINQKLTLQKFVFFLLFTGMVVNASAQNAVTISGFIRDTVSAENLYHATIYESNSKLGTISNAYGFYSLTVPKGKAKLNVSYVGYNPQTIHFNAQNDTTLNFELSSKNDLQEVVVKAEALQEKQMLSSASLAKLEDKGLPHYAVAGLQKVVDEWHVSSWDITKVLFYSKDYEMRAKFSPLLQKEIKEKTVANRERKAFRNGACFGDDSWLNNVSYDVFSVIGEGQNIDQANLLYGNARLSSKMKQDSSSDHEYWLEVIRGDKNYLEYYRTYILQVSQRLNPYSEPVIVHSNIKNATGIFAGYNRQMIYLFYY